MKRLYNIGDNIVIDDIEAEEYSGKYSVQEIHYGFLYTLKQKINEHIIRVTDDYLSEHSYKES